MCVLDQLHFLLTNRNLNTITSATNSRGVSRAFRKYLSAGFCLQRIFIMFSCVRALSVLLSLNLHPHLQLHKFPILVLLSFLPSGPNKVAFVSSRFENPLSRTSYFLDGFQLKKQNMPFKSIMVN